MLLVSLHAWLRRWKHSWVLLSQAEHKAPLLNPTETHTVLLNQVYSKIGNKLTILDTNSASKPAALLLYFLEDSRITVPASTREWLFSTAVNKDKSLLHIEFQRNVSLWKHPVLQVSWTSSHIMFSFFSSMSQHSNLGTQSPRSCRTLHLPPPSGQGRSTTLTAQLQGQTGAPWGNCKCKRKLEHTDLYMQVLEEESRSCPVFHKDQLGVTAPRHQEHHYAPRSPVHSEDGIIQWLMLLTTPPKPASTMSSKTGDQAPVWPGNLQKPACPLLFPRAGGQGVPSTPNTGKFHVSEHMTWGYHRVVNNVELLCCSSQEGNASCNPSLESEGDCFLEHGQMGNSVQSLP